MAELPTGDVEETESAGEKIGDLRPCPKCAQPISNTDPACPHCGQPLVMRSRLATASLVFGILPFAVFLIFVVLASMAIIPGVYTPLPKPVISCLFMFFYLAAIAAIILGFVAPFRIWMSPAPMKGHELALAGIVFGCFNACLLLVSQPHHPSNDTVAIGNLRTITGSQNGYKASNGVYANSFEELTDATNGPAFLLGAWKEDVEKNGYFLTLKATNNGNCYEATADPASPNHTGNRHFFTDCSGVIRWNVGAPADSTRLSIDE